MTGPEDLDAQGEASEGSPARSGLADLLGGVVIVVVSLAFAVAALDIPLASPLWQWYTSPGIYPAAIAVVTGVMALIVALRGWGRWQAGRRTMPWAGFRTEGQRWGLPRLAWFLVLVGGFLLMLGRVPFWASTSLFVLATILTTSRADLRSSLKFGLLGVAVVYVVFVLIFQKLFGIALP